MKVQAVSRLLTTLDNHRHHQAASHAQCVSVATIAHDLGLDPADVDVIVIWLRAHDDRHSLVGIKLDRAVRETLDPDGERTAHAHTCPSCGRWPGRYHFLAGWHPCGCGGHSTTYCRPDTGGCGFEQFDPLLDLDVCRDPGFGFDPPS